ncbi:N-acetylmuramoyl-L-alanine amidase LytC precursor [Peptococcaceae bacterium CEB3]|nr:N-acetylmuramoyl-L-alanine amidase LytC precursor [Peptococcaceae bacterium CEB3]
MNRQFRQTRLTGRDAGPPRWCLSSPGMLVFLGLLLTLTLWLSGPIAAQALPLKCSTDRILGSDRVARAIGVSQAGWSQAGTVLLATANDYPDSLVAVPLAHSLDAPILLTYPNGLDPRVLAEIRRLGATHAIVMGGTGALSDKITQSLRDAGVSVERVGGLDRYQTAVLVAERLKPNGQVILASGENFPDALAVSPYAGVTGTPILLTTLNAVPSSTEAELQKLEAAAPGQSSGQGSFKSLVVGGTGVISSSSLEGLPNVQRLAGEDRYGTAAQVYRFAADVLAGNVSSSDPAGAAGSSGSAPSASSGSAVKHAFLVSGENFPDALVTAALAAKENAPLFMSASQTLPAVTYSAMEDAAVNGLRVTLIGGSNVLSDTVQGMVEGKIPLPYLLGGLTIALDPGHGGADAGAVGPAGTMEKNNTLAVGLDLANILRAAGAKVVLTRTGDAPPTGSAYKELPDLQARVKIANDAKADLFVSIHNDSYPNPAVGGTSTYYSADNPQAAESAKLAQDIQTQTVKALGLQDRGVREAPFYVIKHTTMPAVLVELAFISNPKEEKLLSSPAFRQEAAQGIYQGILAYKGV